MKQRVFNFLILLLMTSTVQAKVYKCPGKVEGQYIYQQSACKGAKVDEHTLTIIPSDEHKIEEARKQMAKATTLDSEKVEPREVILSLPQVAPTTSASPPSTNNNSTAPVQSNTATVPTNPPSEKPATATNSGATPSSSATTPSPNQPTAKPSVK